MARGGFKQKRGGGRNLHKNLVLDENGTAVAKDRWAARDPNAEDDDDSEEEDEEEEEEEESEEEAAAPGATAAQGELSRTERRELTKKKKAAAAQAKGGPAKEDDEDDEEADDPLLTNPNRAAGKRLAISDLSAPRELSRREREEKEKKEAKERYWKLHAQGKTDEAKSDLARLAKIRAEREAAQAKRKAEAESRCLVQRYAAVTHKPGPTAKAAEIEAKRKTEQTARAKRS
ncbi:casein kinase substrate phosphoprotein PP28-domain-containing protein [Daedaleopsis nitida]|nr:casein kinase substrate phosphoprotein PP28-domain-containing protein [Daedaleopsis nitida]